MALRLPEPMLARSGAIRRGRGWVFEPKLDGFRCLICTHALFRARSRRNASAYNGIDEVVFCDPKRGSVYRYETFSAALRAAYAAAGLDPPAGLRPCHDLRVTSITNDALAGAHPVAIMAKAGHGNMTTQALSEARRRCLPG